MIQYIKMTLNSVLVLVSVFSWVLNGCRGYDCSRVSPKWDQYNGKPFVQLADEQSLKVEVAWNWDSVLAGSNCVQAFEVEHQEFGKGRKTWSQWSSLVNCAIVVQDHQDVTEGNFTCHKFLSSIDCDKRMRFRVLMHNIFNEYRVVTPSRYEEALIQCRPIYQKITESIPITSIRSNLFLVRVPHRKRYQRPTIKPVIPTKGPDIASTTTTSPPTTTAKTTHPTAVNTAATTTVLPKVRDPIQEGNNGTDVSGILSIEYPIPNAVPKHVHRDFFVLLSGKYAKMDTTKKYEVRHNLKDFEATSQHLQYCGKYYVQDISDECDLGKIIRRGMHLCLTSTNDFVSNPEVEAQKRTQVQIVCEPQMFGGVVIHAKVATMFL